MTITDSVAVLVTLPPALLAMTETGRPSKLAGTLFNVNEEPVAPVTFTPFVCHWKVGAGLARMTVVLNVILFPAITVMLVGPEIWGMILPTIRTANLLVTELKLLVTTTLYKPLLVPSALAIKYEGPVAPDIGTGGLIRLVLKYH